MQSRPLVLMIIMGLYTIQSFKALVQSFLKLSDIGTTNGILYAIFVITNIVVVIGLWMMKKWAFYAIFGCFVYLLIFELSTGIILLFWGHIWGDIAIFILLLFILFIHRSSFKLGISQT